MSQRDLERWFNLVFCIHNYTVLIDTILLRTIILDYDLNLSNLIENFLTPVLEFGHGTKKMPGLDK